MTFKSVISLPFLILLNSLSASAQSVTLRDSMAIEKLLFQSERLRHQDLKSSFAMATDAWLKASKTKSAWLQEECLLTLLSVCNSNGDQTGFDEYKRALDLSTAGSNNTAHILETQIINAYHQLGRGAFADVYNNCRQALRVAAANNIADTAELYLLMGKSKFAGFGLQEAKNLLKQGLNCVNNDKTTEAELKLNLAKVLFTSGDKDSVKFRYIDDAFSFFRQTKDFSGIAEVYTTLGLSAMLQQNFDLSFRYHQQAADYYLHIGNPVNAANAMTSGGIAMINSHKYDSAFYLLKQANEIYSKSGNPPGLSISSTYLSMLYKQKDSAALAASYLEIAKTVKKDIDIPIFEAITELEESRQAALAGNMDTAKAKYNTAKKAFMQLAPNAYKKAVKQETDLLVPGDTAAAKALIVFNNYETKKAISQQQENNRLIADAGAKYGTGLKADSIRRQTAEIDNKNQEISAKQKWLMAAAIALFMAVLISILLFKRYKKVKEEQLAMEAFTSQMLHESNNAISRISLLLSAALRQEGLFEIDETIKSRLLQVAGLQSEAYLNRSRKQVMFKKFISDSVHHLHQNFSPEKNIHFSINVPEELKGRHAMLLAGLIGELTLNSLKHAFTGSTEGNISISLTPQHKGFTLQYSDNGSGIEPGAVIKESTGSRIIRSIASQLRAKPEIDGNNGYTFVLTFTY